MGKDSLAPNVVPPPGTRICARCQHVRTRPQAELFDRSDLMSPGVLKAKTEWDQQRKQRAEQEAQRLASGLPFDYEPHSFAWCAKVTPLDLVHKANEGSTEAMQALMSGDPAVGGAAMDPVSGVVTAIYVICSQKNPTGQCTDYEPK